ncbi:uncharacterized protein FOMMEDRAFT_152941 [Fomitiporia mediterranea MF3/22]|uniref:uncharacterized protein n=1 Tax=Fomitiporia mediterranea (strain MF3/22) TaxID=694068 RepID=UPI0004408D02|nr:uncharacterized protein FOMMEDRAFT_152941 [Fomitiporia mediterranea MF3/22]EJD05612.1 hypothetical protein FOMMEDRAFT_152941 [Fomitiporia mediterranea MF3/22]
MTKEHKRTVHLDSTSGRKTGLLPPPAFSMNRHRIEDLGWSSVMLPSRQLLPTKPDNLVCSTVLNFEAVDSGLSNIELSFQLFIFWRGIY